MPAQLAVSAPNMRSNGFRTTAEPINDNKPAVRGQAFGVNISLAGQCIGAQAISRLKQPCGELSQRETSSLAF
jgi:hypothetical protein